MNINRRRMLGALGAATGGALLAGLTGSALAGPQHAAKAPVPAYVWTPKKLDAAESALLAYGRTAHEGHSPAYGVFYGLVGQLAEKYGAPYASFPFHMLEAHDPGLMGNAAICGELQGAVSAMGLFWAAPQRNAMARNFSGGMKPRPCRSTRRQRPKLQPPFRPPLPVPCCITSLRASGSMWPENLRQARNTGSETAEWQPTSPSRPLNS